MLILTYSLFSVIYKACFCHCLRTPFVFKFVTTILVLTCSIHLSNGCAGNRCLLVALLAGEHAVIAGSVAVYIFLMSDGLLAFFPAKVQEPDDNNEPVNVVGDDGAVCGAVLPAEQGVEDTPTAVAVIAG